MKNITKILAILLVLTTLFSLFSCNGSNDDTNNDSPEAPELKEVKVGVLKGATGIGAVKLKKDADNKTTEGKYNISFYETSNVKLLTANVINGTVDIAALPINAGASLYNNSNGKVQIIAANALGVLSIIGKDELTSIADLRGKTLHTVQKANTPEYIITYLLQKNGLVPIIDDTESELPENGVRVIFHNGDAAVKLATAAMLEDGGYAMLPEPATTTMLAQNKDKGVKLILSVTEEWDKVCDTKLIQGCLVVNTEFAKNNPTEVAKFLEEYAETVDYVKNNNSAAAELAVEYELIGTKPMAEQSLPRCGIVCLTGSEMKTSVAEMLKVLYNANPSSVGGKLPDDNYYYVAN